MAYQEGLGADQKCGIADTACDPDIALSNKQTELGDEALASLDAPYSTNEPSHDYDAEKNEKDSRDGTSINDSPEFSNEVIEVNPISSHFQVAKRRFCEHVMSYKTGELCLNDTDGQDYLCPKHRGMMSKQSMHPVSYNPNLSHL